MHSYLIDQTVTEINRPQQPGERTLTILSSDELSEKALPGLESMLCHLSPAYSIRRCKAEVRHDCVCGTICTPRQTENEMDIAFSYLLTAEHMAVCDDSGAIRFFVDRLGKEKRWQEGGVGRVLYELIELLIAGDLHGLEELEDQLTQIEDRILSGESENFNPKMTELRKEITSWARYYAQMDDLICELQENENVFFSENEQRLFHMLEKRLSYLWDDSKSLR